LDLGAGDLFTCASTAGALLCWGANRDAFFGVPGSCPELLRQAWPTLHGQVQAPRGACSADPVVVARVDRAPSPIAVGPRGLCFQRDDTVKCLGAIPTPRGHGIASVAVSSGSDASACGLHDGGVVCWGEAYSRPDALDEPVRITLESSPSGAEAAAVPTSNPDVWSASCIARRGCTQTASSLARCDRSLVARDWSALSVSADAMAGQVISVRGVLGVGPASSGPDIACAAPDGLACCHRSLAHVVLGGASLLVLDGYSCRGDDSQLCCNAPAYGQLVVATGRLGRMDTRFADAKWQLSDVALCNE
jgi:hypothetical protein